MFAATEMVAGGEVAFEAMTVDQLKDELAERGSTRSGRKATIVQRRLHTLRLYRRRSSDVVPAWTFEYSFVQSYVFVICLMQGGLVQSHNLTDAWPGPDRRPKFDILTPI